MFIPSGYTESGVLNTFDIVINRIASRYKFYGYSVEDIKQEAFIICLDGLDRFDPSRGTPLENFTSVNLSNRLKNFVRDHHVYQEQNDERFKIIQPGQLDNDNLIVDGRQNELDEEDRLDYKNMSILINKKLPASMRADYLKMQSDVYISKNRRDDIIAEITAIMKDHSNEER